MAREEHCVLFYKTGFATVPVSFANGKVCCKNCEFCYLEYRDSSMQRCRCRLLKDEIIPTECVQFDVLPSCPIVLEDP